MRRLALVVAILLNCASFGTELFAQAGQTVIPVPITPPLLQTAPLTCQINCDTLAMTCQNSCIPTTAAAAATPTTPSSTSAAGACALSCTSQQLVCKQRC